MATTMKTTIQKRYNNPERCNAFAQIQNENAHLDHLIRLDLDDERTVKMI